MLVRFGGGCADGCAGRCAGSDPWITDSSDLQNKYGDQHTWFSSESDESVMPCHTSRKGNGQPEDPRNSRPHQRQFLKVRRLEGHILEAVLCLPLSQDKTM